MLDRIKKLKNLEILDTPEENIFNEIVATASLVCDAPISLITLLDEERQWFKAKHGTEIKETPIGFSICKHVVEETNGALNVEDLTKDLRFQNNPFVTNDPNLKSYLGVSLRTETGERIGTVCVFDDETRKFTEKQAAFLSMLAKYTTKLIEEKARTKQRENQNKTLELINKNLESFVYMVAHDIKAPLRTMNSFSNLVLNENSAVKDSKIGEYLGFINQSSVNLLSLVDRLLTYSRQIQVGEEEFELFKFNDLIEEVIYLLDPRKEKLEYDINIGEVTVFSAKAILRQAIQNIISNAIKYQDENKEIQNLKVELEKVENTYTVTFKDNGIGMSEKRLKEVFDLFSKDNQNHFSTGVGLSVVQELLHKIGGEIKVASQLAQGTNVTIAIPDK